MLYKFTYSLIYPALLGSMLFEIFPRFVELSANPAQNIKLIILVLFFCCDYYVVEKLRDYDGAQVNKLTIVSDLVAAISYRFAFLFITMSKEANAAICVLIVALSIISVQIFSGKIRIKNPFANFTFKSLKTSQSLSFVTIVFSMVTSLASFLSLFSSLNILLDDEADTMWRILTFIASVYLEVINYLLKFFPFFSNPLTLLDYSLLGLGLFYLITFLTLRKS